MALAGGLTLLIAGVAVYLALAPAPARPARASDGEAAAPPPTDTRRAIRTEPPGARVQLGASDLGVTPTVFDLAGLPRQPLELTISKPGYRVERRTITTDASDVALTLQPIVEFAGRWRGRDGTIQALRRDGASVSVVLEAGADRSQHLRFEFVPAPAGGPVVIAGAVPYVHAAAPTDPTCQLHAASRYEYDTTTDTLVVTTEVLQVELMMGQCVVTERIPGRGQALTRL
jgi:hypothetical protein